MPRVKVQVSGVEQVMQQFVELGNALSFTGGNRTVKAYIGASDRSAAHNIKIARINASMGRDPWHVSKGLQDKIPKMVRNAMTDALRSSSSYGKARAMVAGLREIGEKLVEDLENNLLRENYGGKTPRPLTAKYAKRKRKNVGFTHPFLLRYGSLLRAIKYRLERGA